MSHCYTCDTDVVDTATGVACKCMSLDMDADTHYYSDYRVAQGHAIQQASIEDQSPDYGLVCALDYLTSGDTSKVPDNIRNVVEVIGRCYRGDLSPINTIYYLNHVINKQKVAGY